ncbi:MAG: hypothetical protein WAR38_10010 [Chitinophagaceae bacterium]
MFYNLCLQDYWDILRYSDEITLCATKGQSPFATDLFLYGEVPVVNKP